jgi:hypothetical protein
MTMLITRGHAHYSEQYILLNLFCVKYISNIVNYYIHQCPDTPHSGYDEAPHTFEMGWGLDLEKWGGGDGWDNCPHLPLTTPAATVAIHYGMIKWG